MAEATKATSQAVSSTLSETEKSQVARLSAVGMGRPLFSPKSVMGKKGGKLLAEVTIPLVSTPVLLRGGIWESVEGETSILSVSMGSGRFSPVVVPEAGHAKFDAWADALDAIAEAFVDWEATPTNAANVAATQRPAGRLVRKRKTA